MSTISSNEYRTAPVAHPDPRFRQAPAEEVHQLSFVAIDESSWRLCDDALADCEPSSLVGYVHRLEGAKYEVVWVSFAKGTEEFDSLDDVLCRAIAITDEALLIRGSVPAPVPHHPPLRSR